MIHAFLIIAHNNFEILEKQIEILKNKNSDFYIHVDKRAFFDEYKFLKKFPDASIHFIERKKVFWGGASQIDCEYRLLKKATQKHHDYYHLISGTDLPLHSLTEMDQIIKKNGKKEFIHFDSLIITDNIKDRIRYYHFIVSRKEIINCVNKLIIWLQKKMHVNRIKNLDLQIMKGCNWFSITEECAKYVLQKENETKKMFRFSCCGDELFLQTIVYNSKFRSNISIHNYQDNYECCLRLIDWKRGYPYTFRSQDFQSLINSECLFARKFDYLSYPDVIDDLFKYLLNKKKK